MSNVEKFQFLLQKRNYVALIRLINNCDKDVFLDIKKYYDSLNVSDTYISHIFFIKELSYKNPKDASICYMELINKLSKNNLLHNG